MFEALIESWEGEETVVHHDAPSGTWMFVCLHSSALGPASGGTRMKVYDTASDGLADAMDLSAAMTRKFAVAGLPMGGGKAVLAVRALPDPDARRQVIERYADIVASLHGGYWTGPDMNTSEADMDLVYDRCPYAFGRSPSRGGSGDSAPDTAVGVFHGIRASVAYAFDSPELSGRTVMVQGAGRVGSELVGHLVEAGAKVLVSDVVEDRARALAEGTGSILVPAGEEFAAECDVFAPCATGGVLSARSIPELQCRVVAGSANNQLTTAADALALRDRGILYAPDYVINAGGALHLVGQEALGWGRDELDRRLVGIGEVLGQIYREADTEGVSTEEAAERIARARLAAAR